MVAAFSAEESIGGLVSRWVTNVDYLFFSPAHLKQTFHVLFGVSLFERHLQPQRLFRYIHLYRVCYAVSATIRPPDAESNDQSTKMSRRGVQESFGCECEVLVGVAVILSLVERQSKKYLRRLLCR